jgi:hypothetical protein
MIAELISSRRCHLLRLLKDERFEIPFAKMPMQQIPASRFQIVLLFLFIGGNKFLRFVI